MPDEQVVSGSTETLEPSTDGTQTQGTETPAAPPEPINWRQRQREDAELNAHVQSEIARARTRWQRQQLREHAKAATEANDPNYLRYVAQQAAAEQDDNDDGGEGPVDHNWLAAADRAQPRLDQLTAVDADGRATNPYYVLLHQREGRAAMDRRYQDDPIGFVNWVDEQIFEMRVAEGVKRIAPGMAQAMAQDEAHARLRGQPVPIGGSTGGSSALTPEAYSAMSFAERQKLRKENPRAIDDMIARASR